jgi:hypothetical protein
MVSVLNAAHPRHSGNSFGGGKPCCAGPSLPSHCVVDLYSSWCPSLASAAQRLYLLLGPRLEAARHRPEGGR